VRFRSCQPCRIPAVITALDDASGRTRPAVVVTAAGRWVVVVVFVVIVGFTS
jgi:hypothetical protein